MHALAAPLSMPPTRHRRLTLRIVAAMLTALLAAQWWVLGHAIAHGSAHASAQGVPHGMVVSAANASAVVDIGDGPDTVWGHEAGAPECRLLDQLLGGQAMRVDAASMPGSPSASTPLAGNDLSPCRQPTLRTYLARGPPPARAFT